ncbi:MAG: ankyrin repeat domain-containing protein [Myxococcales bacterium]|nr:ankyrin repeat domain-containing protein [Myxococcales bacterium]
MARGTTSHFDLEPPEQGDAWSIPSWHALVFPNDDGELHHGSRGANLPDTVVVRLHDREVALADIFADTIENQYCWDCEYFLTLRVREVLEPDLWALLPWPHLEPGDVFVAYDKFHGHEYSRTPGDEASMSYGGDWSDLQAYIDGCYPRPEGSRPAGPPSATTLLRAVRAGDVALVRALLAAGADPGAGSDPPGAALRAVSVDRDTTALWEAIGLDSPALVEALLAAGASLRPPSPAHMPPLQGALLNRRLAVVPVLLRFGADPDASFDGRTARDMAAAIGPEALALLPPRQ